MMLAPTPLNESQRLEELCSYKLLDSAPDSDFDAVTELASQLCDVPTALISLVDERRQWFKSKVGFDELQTARDISFCGHAICENNIMEVQDALEDERFRDNPFVTHAPYIRFYAGAPLIADNGHTLGTLCVIDTKPRALTAIQKKSLTQLARQVVAQMQLKRTTRYLENQIRFQQSILHSTDSLVMATNLDGLITHFNAAAETLLECSAANVINSSTPLAFYERSEVAARQNELAQQRGKVINQELLALVGCACEGKIERRMWTMVSSTGRTIDVELTVSPLQENDGQTTGYLYVAQNLSNTKRVQEALFLEKKRLQGVIEGTSAGTWEWNIPNKSVIVNERWAQIMGFTLDQISPIDLDQWRARVHPDDIEKSEQLLSEHFKGNSDVFENEFRLKHNNQSWIWVQSHGRVVSRRADGTPLMMYGIHIDISARKASEKALFNRKKELEVLVNQRTEELANNVSFVNSVIESSPDCLKVLSLDAKLLYMTAKGCKIMEVDDFCDIQGADWLAFWDDKDKPAVTHALDESRAGRPGRFQAMTPTMKGTEKWWDVMISPILGANGEPGKLLSVSRDITHQKKLEEQLRQWNADLEKRIEMRTVELAKAREAAEAANHAKTTFLTSMSHEIRTPLNAIIGMSELMEQTNAEEERHRLLKLTQESAHSLLDIISDILDLSKIEAGQLDVNLEPMSVHSALKFAGELFSQAAHAKGLYLRTKFDNNIPHSLHCDPLRLRQILFNLLGNAVKFTNKGGIDLEARVAEQIDNTYTLKIQVIDTGIGIGARVQKQIFEPFIQASQDTTKKFGGTGLGLAISKRLADLLGGSLSLQSTLDKGTCMTVTLPLRACTESETSHLVEQTDQGDLVETAETPTPIPDYVTKAKILIADDNAINRALLENQLRLLGCTSIDMACDGLEALSKWTAEKYDLIICDCQMPKMDGYDVAQHIREINTLHLNRRVVPFVGYTADALNETRQRCLNAGMDDVLIKPVGLHTLKAMLVEWLQPSHVKPAAIASLVSPVDWEALDEITGNNRDFAKDLLLAFVANKGKHLQKLENMIKTDDQQGILQVVHKIKGSALGLCAKPLAETCHLIETAARQGDTKVIKTGKELLEADFARIKDLLQNC